MIELIHKYTCNNQCKGNIGYRRAVVGYLTALFLYLSNILTNGNAVACVINSTNIAKGLVPVWTRHHAVSNKSILISHLLVLLSQLIGSCYSFFSQPALIMIFVSWKKNNMSKWKMSCENLCQHIENTLYHLLAYDFYKFTLLYPVLTSELQSPYYAGNLSIT